VDAVQVKTLVAAHLDGCEVIVQGEGNSYDITAVGDVFSGMRPVQKQQLVYGALGEQIADGSIHAVNISTYTPDEWRSR